MCATRTSFGTKFLKLPHIHALNSNGPILKKKLKKEKKKKWVVEPPPFGFLGVAKPSPWAVGVAHLPLCLFCFSLFLAFFLCLFLFLF